MVEHLFAIQVVWRRAFPYCQVPTIAPCEADILKSLGGSMDAVSTKKEGVEEPGVQVCDGTQWDVVGCHAVLSLHVSTLPWPLTDRGIIASSRRCLPVPSARRSATLSTDPSPLHIMLDGQELEFDLYGNGQRDGGRVIVVGEVRSRIYGRDVEDAVRRTTRLTSQLSGTQVTVLFGFVIHPSAWEAAQRLGAIVISSSGR
jgi:hypothetical protein